MFKLFRFRLFLRFVSPSHPSSLGYTLCQEVRFVLFVWPYPLPKATALRSSRHLLCMRIQDGLIRRQCFRGCKEYYRCTCAPYATVRRNRVIPLLFISKTDICRQTTRDSCRRRNQLSLRAAVCNANVLPHACRAYISVIWEGPSLAIGLFEIMLTRTLILREYSGECRGRWTNGEERTNEEAYKI